MTEKLQNPFKINELITAVNSLVDSEGSSTPDNLSITQNASSNLQTIGVINQNATTTAIKTWTGTKAQYDAITIKDNNTLYNITDDMQAVTYEAYSKSETDTLLTNSISALLTSLYPVGSIYIGTQSTCPLAILISGSTWVKVSEGRVLQGSDGGHNAGTTIEAGLPNHTHHIGVHNANGQSSGGGYIPANSFNAGSVIVNSGVNGESGNGNWTDRDPTQYNYDKPQMTNASDDNLIYGNSNTVQPSAYVVNIWRRTA